MQLCKSVKLWHQRGRRSKASMYIHVDLNPLPRLISNPPDQECQGRVLEVEAVSPDNLVVYCPTPSPDRCMVDCLVTTRIPGTLL